MSDLADVICAERERLHQERAAITSQQEELLARVALIDRELLAVDAYEAAKTGKLVAAVAKPARTRRTTTGATQQRRGSKRGALLQLIGDHPAGLTRGQILEKMGLKGDQSGEMSVSNALTGLTKAGSVYRSDGMYFAAPGAMPEAEAERQAAE